MKPNDVTSNVLGNFRSVADSVIVNAAGKTLDDLDKEIIAAAFNAVVSDAEPITAEWLEKRGYESDGLCWCARQIEPELSLGWDGHDVAILDDSGATILPTKTIGQLRALHAGLGIGEVQS